jgi:uncharacterized DUF497 family protein
LTNVYERNIHEKERGDPEGENAVGLNRLSECGGFEWDEGNTDKNRTKHGVSPPECEQIFLNLPLVVESDTLHSQVESRFYALGQTDAARRLFVVFTIRADRIRVISARDMNRKERRVYHEKEDSEIRE